MNCEKLCTFRTSHCARFNLVGASPPKGFAFGGHTSRAEFWSGRNLPFPIWPNKLFGARFSISNCWQKLLGIFQSKDSLCCYSLQHSGELENEG